MLCFFNEGEWRDPYEGMKGQENRNVSGNWNANTIEPGAEQDVEKIEDVVVLLQGGLKVQAQAGWGAGPGAGGLCL